jgi:hypothetical protein
VLLLKRIGILPILGVVLLVAIAPEAVTEFCKVVAEAILSSLLGLVSGDG